MELWFWSFKLEDSKLNKILPKNEEIQCKWQFLNLNYVEPTKIGHILTKHTSL